MRSVGSIVARARLFLSSAIGPCREPLVAGPRHRLHRGLSGRAAAVDPSGFRQLATTQNEVVLTWGPSSDDVGVVGYGVPTSRWPLLPSRRQL